MIYTVENTFEAGRPVERVVDANGLEYTHAITIDTETGEIERFKTDGGRLIVDHATGCVERETVHAVPPILVTFRKMD
jgi:hypothetical protein